MGHRKRESRSAENIPQWVAILLLQHNLYAPASRSPLTPRPCAPYLTWFWWRHSQGGPHCEYVMCESGCIRLVGKWMAWLNRNTLYYFICSSTKTAYKRVGGATSRTAEKQKCLKDFGSCRVTEPSSAELSSVREQQFSGGKGILLVTWLPSKVCNANKFSFMWPTLNFRSHFAPGNRTPLLWQIIKIFSGLILSSLFVLLLWRLIRPNSSRWPGQSQRVH